MTLEEEVIACARSQGYNGKTTIAHRKNNEWQIIYIDELGDGNIYKWIVTDKKFKKWKRDLQLNRLLK